jgi:hypothetical protein
MTTQNKSKPSYSFVEITRGLPKGFNRPMGELAKIGYEAYGDNAHDGKPMPRWEDLPVHLRDRWMRAVGAVAKALAKDE